MAGASSKQNPYPGAVLNSKISTSYIKDFDDTQIVGSIDRSSGAHHNGLSGEAAARTLAPTSAAASGRRKAALRPPTLARRPQRPQLPGRALGGAAPKALCQLAGRLRAACRPAGADTSRLGRIFAIAGCSSLCFIRRYYYSSNDTLFYSVDAYTTSRIFAMPCAPRYCANYRIITSTLQTQLERPSLTSDADSGLKAQLSAASSDVDWFICCSAQPRPASSSPPRGSPPSASRPAPYPRLPHAPAAAAPALGSGPGPST